MSLYNAVFGANAAGPALVALLNERHPVKVGRFRDAWVEHDGDDLVIRVHTRNGGGNRECWCSDEPCTCGCPRANESMEAHPWYVRDEDDDFDSTYADFWFRPELAALDPEVARALVAMAQAPVDMAERWNAAIEAIGGGEPVPNAPASCSPSPTRVTV